MCGIAGVVDHGAAADGGLVAAMCDRIVHRGPDARGIHVAGEAALGIQRLAIIDVAGGDQPLFSEDGQIAVVMNGEIYNFQELRERLRERGHVFSSGSDAEVIVHLYEEHGDALVDHLRGMFAFAIWDARRRRLLLGRDRVGKKPLFYSAANGRIAFASELGALLADPSLDTTIDPRAVDAYLAFQYVPHPLSIFAAVRKLPPASLLAFEEGRPPVVSRYWTLDYGTKLEGIGESEAAELLRDQLDEATRIRLMSEVPLGAFLSGGIDSSAVVASMAEQTSEPVKTFSISFGEADFDEVRFARMVADRYATEHHEFRVEPHALAIRGRLARHYGEPFADPSAIPTFYLAELTGRHVTVALNGDGGDEAFGGYGRYRRMERLLRLRRGLGPVRGTAGRLAMRLGSDGAERAPRTRLALLGRSLTAPEWACYGDSVYAFDAPRRQRLIAPAMRAELDGWRAESFLEEAWARVPHGVDRLLAVDSETYLPGDLLPKVDIATMAHSVEARSPFLDHRLLEFAASLPGDLKLSGGSSKRVLKAAMRGIVPDAILDRPKMGFGVPLKHWYRGELAALPRELLLDPAAHCRRYLVGAEIERVLAEHAAGSHDHALRIWALMQLETWHREVLEPARSARRGAAHFTQ
jgi:asparagine synthase (glutamine-hydrolysing)